MRREPDRRVACPHTFSKLRRYSFLSPLSRPYSLSIREHAQPALRSWPLLRFLMNDATDNPVAGDVHRAALANQVEALLARLHASVAQERRRDERVAIPVLFRLTPLDVDRQTLEHESSIVVGKNISRRGLCFYHEWPIPHRRALIAVAQSGLGSFAAEIDISWCRFTRPGWYESGGRLVRLVAQEIEPESQEHEPAGMSQLASFFGPPTEIATA